jgi:hypothetical protein
MTKHRLKRNFAHAPGIKILLCLLLSLSLWACERDTIATEIVGLSPAQGAEVTPGAIHFKWVSNGYGDYHFRLGTADMQVILLDTVLSASELRVMPGLVRGAAYHWEVTQAGAELARDFVTADIATLLLLSPAEGAALPLTGNTFTWEHFSQGPFQFRLGDSGMAHLLVEETVTGHSYTPNFTLQPGGSYQWEVATPGEVASARFKGMSLQQLAAGQHGGQWTRKVYSDPNTTITTGAGVLRVVPDGAGYTVEVIGQTDPVYVQPTSVYQGVQYCSVPNDDYPHNFTDFEFDFVHYTYHLITRRGVGNASFNELVFDSN